ncbi:MAG: hypothetical protein H6711_34550 [Myxococcales bacterium]|nr:hypothetical protein [Myxococcales bacterium]
MSERTIAPDDRRLREAAQAGVRRRPRWLARGLLCLALATLLDGLGSELREGLGDALPEALRGGDPGALLERAATLSLAIHGVAALALVGASALVGGLGPVSSPREPAMIALRDRPTPGLWPLAGLLVGIALLLHRGVIAGAARAVDAGPAELLSFWSGWLSAGLTIGGGLLIAGGLAELALDERGRRRALRRSPEELRDDARRRGRGPR